MQCPHSWQINFAITLLGAVLAGILLVAVIMTLKLTVAVRIMQLCNYANIIDSSSATFFPTSFTKFSML